MDAQLKLLRPKERTRPVSTRDSIASQVSRMVALESWISVGVMPSWNQPGG